MTLEENLFWAKRNVVDSIYRSARLEGIAVTYPQTELIYDGFGVANLTLKEINIIVNLKRVWEFLEDNITYQIDLDYLIKLNKIIGDNSVIYSAGNLRVIDANIGGIKYRPEIPNKAKIVENLDRLSQIQDIEKRALFTMLYLMRSQIFNDGNKRTAMIAANQILIQNGCGVFSVAEERLEEFKTLLIKFYETDNYNVIFDFLKSCIDFRQNLSSTKPPKKRNKPKKVYSDT